MTILTWPAGIGISRVRWHARANTQSFTSPLNRTTQTRWQPGTLWTAGVSVAPMDEAQWRVFSAFVARMEGEAGRLYFGPPHAKAPRGSVAGTPVVNGANQTGSQLALKGFTSGAAGVLLTGDYIAVDVDGGRSLFLVTADVNADGSGNANVLIKPRIRLSPADEAAVITASPTCVMKLESDDTGGMDFDPGVLGVATVSLVEAFV